MTNSTRNIVKLALSAAIVFGASHAAFANGFTACKVSAVRPDTAHRNITFVSNSRGGCAIVSAGDVIGIAGEKKTEHGYIVIAKTRIVYVANPGYTGPDHFALTYTLQNGNSVAASFNGTIERRE